MRLFLGLIKGAIIGGGLGFGFSQLGSLAQQGFMNYLLYAAIGALVGFIAGKPFWKHDTIWTPVVKALVGAGVAIGLYVLATRVLGDPKLSFLGEGMTLSSAPYLLGGGIGGLWGIFVELDDGGKSAPKDPARPAPNK